MCSTEYVKCGCTSVKEIDVGLFVVVVFVERLVFVKRRALRDAAECISN